MQTLRDLLWGGHTAHESPALPTSSNRRLAVSLRHGDDGDIAPARLECAAVLQGHEDRVWAVEWHPCGNLLVSCSGDATARLWRRRKLDAGAMQENAECVSGGAPLVTAAASGYTWEPLETLRGSHQRTIRSASWSADGRRLALSSFDATVSIWCIELEDASGGLDFFDAVSTHHFAMKHETVLDGHDSEVKSVVWYKPALSDAAAGSDRLATCSRDRTVWVWEQSIEEAGGEELDLECVAVLPGHSQDVKSVCWVPHDGSLLSCSYDETLRHWKDRDGKGDWQCVQTLGGHSGTVWEAAVQPIPLVLPMPVADDSDEEPPQYQVVQHAAPLICSCSDDGSIKVWLKVEAEPRAGEGATTEEEYVRTKFMDIGTCTGLGKGETIYSISWCPCWAGSGADSGAKGALVSDLVGVATASNALAVVRLTMDEASADVGWDAIKARKDMVRFERVSEVEKAHAGEVNCVRFAPGTASSGSTRTFELASGGDDGAVRVWKLTFG